MTENQEYKLTLKEMLFADRLKTLDTIVGHMYKMKSNTTYTRLYLLMKVLDILQDIPELDIFMSKLSASDIIDMDSDSINKLKKNRAAIVNQLLIIEDSVKQINNSD